MPTACESFKRSVRRLLCDGFDSSRVQQRVVFPDADERWDIYVPENIAVVADRLIEEVRAFDRRGNAIDFVEHELSDVGSRFASEDLIDQYRTEFGQLHHSVKRLLVADELCLHRFFVYMVGCEHRSPLIERIEYGVVSVTEHEHVRREWS